MERTTPHTHPPSVLRAREQLPASGSASARRHPTRGDRRTRPARTAQPLGGDVLQHGEGDAEEGDEEVAERQGADEDVGDGPHGSAAGHHVEHQAVAEKRQGEDEHADEDEGHLGTARQLRDVHQRLQPVQGDELLSRHVVVPQELRELLRGDVQGAHDALLPSRSVRPSVPQRARSRPTITAPRPLRPGARRGAQRRAPPAGANFEVEAPPAGSAAASALGRGEARQPISAQLAATPAPAAPRAAPLSGAGLR